MIVPRRCRFGVHHWQVVAVAGRRRVAGLLLGSVTLKCGRCPASRHEQNVAVADPEAAS